MGKDDEWAGEARAESSIQDVNRLPSSGSTTEKEHAGGAGASEESSKDTKETPSVESPREFIRRRMRELDAS